MLSESHPEHFICSLVIFFFILCSNNNGCPLQNSLTCFLFWGLFCFGLHIQLNLISFVFFFSCWKWTPSFWGRCFFLDFVTLPLQPTAVCVWTLLLRLIHLIERAWFSVWLCCCNKCITATSTTTATTITCCTLVLFFLLVFVFHEKIINMKNTVGEQI